MKNYLTYKVLSLIVMVSFIAACKKKTTDPEPTSTTGTVKLMIDNVCLDLDGNMSAPVVLDSFGYKTAEGDTISFSHVKYFISNVQLVDANNTSVALDETYWLKNQNSENTSYRSMKEIANVPTGTYKKLILSIGVAENCNTVEACTTGDLDPYSSDAEKMIWDWALGSGYKFLRTEGKFLGNNTSGTGSIDGNFTIHVGSNSNYKTLTFESGDDIVIEENKTTMIHFEAMLHQIFTNPTSIDLEANSSHAEIGASVLANNYENGFLHMHHVNDPM